MKFELSQRGNQKALAAYNLYRRHPHFHLSHHEIHHRVCAFPYRTNHRLPLAAYRALAGKASARWEKASRTQTYFHYHRSLLHRPPYNSRSSILHIYGSYQYCLASVPEPTSVDFQCGGTDSGLDGGNPA